MVIKRRPTPTTVQLKEQLSVLGSLSAWTDNDDDERETKGRKDGYKKLGDEDEPEESRSKYKMYVAPFLDVESNHYNMFIGLVILMNALLIGIETDYGREQFHCFEHFFNGCFFIEMLMRVTQLRMDYFYETWNLFDFTLVITGTLDLWVLPVLTGDSASESAGGFFGFTSLRLLRMIRVLRLMRVLRVVRIFRMFRQLFLIMQAFAKAFQVVLIVSGFIIILNYCYAIVLTQVVGHRAAAWPEDKQPLITNWFGSISASMRTMFFVMTLSDWDVIPMTLIEVLPALPVMCAFGMYILVASYTMVSLISGIISESLIASQQDYKHKKLIQIEDNRTATCAETLQELQEVLEDSMNEIGQVPADELKQQVRGYQDLQKKLLEIHICISDSRMVSLIDSMVDNEENKLVFVQDFVDKLCHLTGDAKGKDVIDVKHEVRACMRKIDKLDKSFNAFQTEVMQKNGSTFETKQLEGHRMQTSHCAPYTLMCAE